MVCYLHQKKEMGIIPCFRYLLNNYYSLFSFLRFVVIFWWFTLHMHYITKNIRIKIIIICALLIGLVNANAQSKLSFGISTSYLKNYRIFSKSNSRLYKDYRNDGEGIIFGFDIEANLFFNFYPKIKFETGIGYIQKGYMVNEERLIDPCFSPVTCGYYSDLYRYKYEYISIPIRFIYTTSNKLNFSISAGASIFVPMSSNVDWILRKEFGNQLGQNIYTRENISNMDRINLTLDLGLGLGYRITENLNAVIQPKFSLDVFSYENTDIRDKIYNICLFNNEDKSTKEHLISYGISSKLIYDF